MVDFAAVILLSLCSVAVVVGDGNIRCAGG